LIRDHPSHALYLAKLAWAESKLGKHDDARRHLEEAVKSAPDDPVIKDIQKMLLRED
jgi:tetratricopeptide (TPR) repeat protein